MKSEPAAVLIKKLESIGPLSDEARAAIRDVQFDITHVKADHELLREGDKPSRSCVVVDGFACRYKLTAEGKRQLLSFHIAGDLPDLQSLFLTTMDHGIIAMMPSTFAWVAHEDLLQLCERHGGLAVAFWRDTLVDAAIFREWILNVGRRSAYQRLGHLLCETYSRMRVVGLVRENTFDFPITQSELADATGISTVHVNRTVQELRAAGLVTIRAGRVTIHDFDRLRAESGFDATYLHVQSATAA